MLENPELITQIVLGVLGGALGLMIGLIVGQPMGAAGKLIGLIVGAAAAAASVVFLTSHVLPYSQSLLDSLSAPDERMVLEARLREEPLIDAHLTRYPEAAGGYVTRLQEVRETGGDSAVNREVLILLRQFELQAYSQSIPRAFDERVRAVFESLRNMISQNRDDPEFCRAYGIRPDIAAAAIIASRRAGTPGFDDYIAALTALYDDPPTPPRTVTFEMRNDILRPVGTAMRAGQTPLEDWYWTQRRPRTEHEFRQSCLTQLRMFDIIEDQRDPELAMRAFFALTQES